MRKAVFCLALVLLLTSAFSAFAARKNTEPVVTSEPIPEPTANPDAEPYDPEHPDELTPDQLWAASAVLMTQDKGEVIFEKDPDAIRYPASMTKIMTVWLGIMFVEDLNETVTVSETAVAVPEDSSTMHLKPGEEIRFIDVLYGTMLVSANDGANVIAEVVSGDISRFVDLMNSTSLNLGCQNTHFMNPHGYHDDNHYSTARDMAIIAREAMKNETFRDSFVVLFSFLELFHDDPGDERVLIYKRFARNHTIDSEKAAVFSGGEDLRRSLIFQTGDCRLPDRGSIAFFIDKDCLHITCRDVDQLDITHGQVCAFQKLVNQIVGC